MESEEVRLSLKEATVIIEGREYITTNRLYETAPRWFLLPIRGCKIYTPGFMLRNS